MRYVCSVSGAAAITQSAREISRSRSSGPCTPVRATRPTSAVVTPRAFSVRTIARPIGPEPTTRARVPATRRVSRCRQTRSRWCSRVRGRSLAAASTRAATYSAIGCSKIPRAFVTTVSDAASSGHIRWSTPALAVCTQRGRGPSPGHARRTACEVKSHTSSTSAPGSRSARCAASVRTIRARPVRRPSRGGGSASRTTTVGTVGVMRGGSRRLTCADRAVTVPGPTTLAPGPPFVNTGAATVRCPLVSRCETGADAGDRGRPGHEVGCAAPHWVPGTWGRAGRCPRGARTARRDETQEGWT
ncbi:hypothetical protein SCANM63S_04367 [Streptomyces canarius]